MDIPNYNSKESQSADMSYSMIIDNYSPKNPSFMHHAESLSKIQSRQRVSWVDDTLINRCFSCNSQFTFYLRSHHCRKCGNVYCYKCSDNWSQIPDSCQGGLPVATENLKNTISKILWSTGEVRLCDECFREIKTIRRFENLFKIFHLLDLTVNDYRCMKRVCKSWNHSANHYLSKFREIQYKLPYQELTTVEKKLLLNNYHLFKGHSVWEIAAARLTGKLPSQLQPQSQSQVTTSCKHLLCTRVCTNSIPAFSAIPLLYKCENIELLNGILNLINEVSDIEFKCYIPLLVHSGGKFAKSSNERNLIAKALINRSEKCMLIAGYTYWEWKIKTGWDKSLVELLQNVDSNTVEYLKRIEAFVDFLESIPATADLQTVKTQFRKNINVFANMKVPTNPNLLIKSVTIDSIRKGDSASRPIFIPLKCVNIKTGIPTDYILLYKFENVRKDLIVINTIRLMDIVIQAELPIYRDKSCQETPIKIITYNVFPTSNKAGLIEIIPNCNTLYNIQKNFTILNYIIENNQGSGRSACELRQRFINSTAAYCVMTFLLGVGDRHLDNIMVNKQGYLFHIDYGFIIGEEPKPVKCPAMRLTGDMLDAIGGVNSKYYKDFVNLSKDIHLCLQKRLAVFFTVLCCLVETPRQEEYIITELTNRFMYGENYEQSGKQLSIHISNSSDNYNGAIIDFFHYHGQEGTLDTLWQNTSQWLCSFLTTF